MSLLTSARWLMPLSSNSVVVPMLRPPESLKRMSSRYGSSRPAGHAHRGIGLRRELTVLGARLLADLDEAGAVGLATRRRHPPGDGQPIALGVVAADLRAVPDQEPLVAHPVGHLLHQPRCPFGAVVVGARCPDLAGEVLVPVHPLGERRARRSG